MSFARPSRKKEPNRPIRAAFCDRDGTIIEDYPDEAWANVREPIFLPGAISGLRHVSACGYKIIILTNQYLIEEGTITHEQYVSVNSKMLRALEANGVEVAEVFYCPHRRDAQCPCMKPRPGMLQAAIRKYPSIILQDSFFMGDSRCDCDLARSFSIPFFSVGFSDCSAFARIDSLQDLTRFIKA